MKKLLIFISVVSVAFTGCLKSTPPNDFSTVKPIVELPYSGFEYLGSDALNLTDDPQDVAFTVNLASVYPLQTDIPITVGYDAKALALYNSKQPATAQFEKFPDSTYSFSVKKGTIKAGKRLDTFHIKFFTSKIDPSKNYALPVSILDAGGQTISGNFGTHYFHVIGNPLAGAYNWDFLRYNRSTPTGSLSGASFLGGSTSFKPDDATTIEVASGYYIQPRYIITFDNNGGVLSNFQVAFNPDDLASLIGAGITVITAPHFTIVDPVNKIFQIEYLVFNGAAYRYIIDKYYK
ncbi:MAG: hypothetical protein NVS3B19_14640 [Ginsengibacter sp.]